MGSKAYCFLQSRFQLIAAMNPCPCGFYGDTQKPCTCASAMVTKYQKRISGPLLDHICGIAYWLSVNLTAATMGLTRSMLRINLSVCEEAERLILQLTTN